MKLKDNFYKIVPCDETDKYEQAVDNCVKISKDYADDFAKGLCEWMKENKGITKINLDDLVSYIPEYEKYLERK
jgi:hypothetical protein